MLRFGVPLATLLVPTGGASASISPPPDPVPAISIADATTTETNFDTVAASN
jgi:hypothetical protein